MSESDPNSVAPDMAGAAAPESMVEPAVRIAGLEAELAELKDRALRAQAELENFRRRAERERDDMAKFAVTKFARDLLSVADNLRRAIDNAPKEGDEAVKALLSGVEVTERELLTAFERHQVKPIQALGQRFDANFHEAVMEIPDPTKPAGTIVQVLAPGYTIAGRLLRAAMVGVAKGGPKEPSGQAIDTNV